MKEPKGRKFNLVLGDIECVAQIVTSDDTFESDKIELSFPFDVRDCTNNEFIKHVIKTEENERKEINFKIKFGDSYIEDLNENGIIKLNQECLDYISNKLNIPVYSVDTPTILVNDSLEPRSDGINGVAIRTRAIKENNEVFDIDIFVANIETEIFEKEYRKDNIALYILGFLPVITDVESSL
jgi:hypothetical protein